VVFVSVKAAIERVLDRLSLVFCWIGAVLLVVGGISLAAMALTHKSSADLPTSESQMNQWQPPDDRGWSDGR